MWNKLINRDSKLSYEIKKIHPTHWSGATVTNILKLPDMKVASVVYKTRDGYSTFSDY